MATRSIVIDDRETIEIKNSNGEVTGSFLWNPTDFDIIKRYDKVRDYFESMKIDNNDDGTDAAMKISDEIKENFDYLLNSKASETLFKNCNPLTPRSDGELYAEYVLNIIVKFIEKEMDTRLKKAKTRADKYTKKYHK
ncbi:MAG: hypothetical protein ACRDBM_17310 [Sporomusa sp.]